MKTVAIIQARLGSTRFPGKVLADLCGKPVIQHVIERVRIAERIGQWSPNSVVVATSESTSDDALAEWCSEFGVNLFRGSEHDVLSRFTECAAVYRADVVLRICGDSPLLEPDSLPPLIDDIRRGADYAAYRLPSGLPAIGTKTGVTCEALTRYCLAEENRTISPLDDNREHVTRRIYTEPTRWVVKWLPLDWGTRECAIDTFEDLQRVRGYMEEELVCASK